MKHFQQGKNLLVTWCTKHQKDEKYKRSKYALSTKATTWKCGTCGQGFKSTTVLADHTVTHQCTSRKNIPKLLQPNHMEHFVFPAVEISIPLLN